MIHNTEYQLDIINHFGYMTNIDKDYSHFIDDYIFPIEFALSKRFSESKYPLEHFNFPRYGLSFIFADLKDAEILGKLYTLNIWTRVYLIEYKRYKLSIKAAFGGAYVSKHFHPTENYKNLNFSTPVVANFGFDLTNEMILINNLSVGLGINFNHFSNGEIRLPNDGMNIPSLSTSLIYNVKSKPCVSEYHNNNNNNNNNNKQTEYQSKKTGLLVFITLGSHDAKFAPKSYNLTSSLGIELHYDLTKWNRLTTGINLFYDKAQAYRDVYNDEINGSDMESKIYPFFTSGFYIGHEINMKPLIVLFHFGTYLHNKSLFENDTFFNRIGLRYFIGDHLFINITHKSGYFFKGNNIEWGVGYEF